MKSTSILRPLLATLATIGTISATIRCASPTLVEVQIFADRVCALYPDATLQVSSGAVELLASPNVINASDAKLCSGRVRIDGISQPVHTAYVQPSDLKNARFGFRSVVSPTGDLEACRFENRFEGCIVSRRIFRFSPGDTTRLRIELHPECISKDAECAAFGYGTCVAGGACGGAEVRADANCSGPGCGEESLASSPSQDDGGIARQDASFDAGPSLLDAGVDASSSSPARGFSTLAAGRASTCAVQRGKLYCWGKFISVGARLFGRANKGTAPGSAEPLATLPTIFAAFDNPNISAVLGVQLPSMTEYLGDTDLGSGSPVAAFLERPCILAREGTTDQVRCDFAAPPLAIQTAVAAQSKANQPIPFPATAYAFGLQSTTFVLPSSAVLFPLVPTVFGLQSTGDLERSFTDYAGNTTSQLVHPTSAGGPSQVTRVRAAFGHVCIVTMDHRVYCDAYSDALLGPWFSPSARVGSTPFYELTNRLQIVGEEVVDVAPGDANICTLLRRGATERIVCAGRNDKGLTFADPSASLLLGTRDVTGLQIQSIRVGGGHACALSADGKLRCWGFGANGELGATTPQGFSTDLLEVPLSNIVEVALGSTHTCARRENDQIFCWGQNFDGTATGAVGSNAPTRVLQ